MYFAWFSDRDKMTEKERYPWLRLLELELAEPKRTETRRPGRPRKPFPRRRVRSALTEDEQATLDDLVDLLSERFGRRVHRGHLIAFLTFRMRSKLQGKNREIVLPEEVDSFVALSKYLDSKRS